MRLPENFKEYKAVADYIANTPIDECFDLTRELLRQDLYFLLRYACGRADMEHPWLLERCKEVQANPDGYLDLWAREHYKSTIITFGLSIQDVLSSHGENPHPKWKGIQPTFGIFSHTRGIAIGFLNQIKREFESNDFLRDAFPDIIWENPARDSSRWSESGLILKRRGNPKESTFEAYGLVEGQPTSKHFDVMIYDDVVTLESVRSPEMIRKTIEAWEMSINLGGGDCRRRHIGTRYHFNDAYRDIMNRKAAIPRIYTATKDGTMEGEPSYKSREWIQERRILLGPFTFATQMLQNPLADSKESFKKEWLQFHSGDAGSGCNRYLIVDPASEKKKTSDYTSAFVIGLGSDRRYRVLDMVRDRLSLVERGDMVFMLHRKWNPRGVGYEQYGMQADIEYFKERMKQENYYFEITKLGGQIPKNDRIKRLVPSLEEGRWLFPETLYRTDYQGKSWDLVDVYINEEFLTFPVSVHDDMLDCQSRIVDPELNAIWPRAKYNDEHNRYSGKGRVRKTSAWGS